MVSWSFRIGIIGVDFFFLLDLKTERYIPSLTVITRTGGYFDVCPRLIIRVFKLFLTLEGGGDSFSRHLAFDVFVHKHTNLIILVISKELSRKKKYFAIITG